MANRGVLIRGSFDDYPNYSRISMGKLEDIEVFQKVFTEEFNA